LRVALPGAWLVPVPTFEEYVKPRADSVLLTSAPPEFRLDVAALLAKLRGVAALALVNPNNPTGDRLAPVRCASWCAPPVLRACGFCWTSRSWTSRIRAVRRRGSTPRWLERHPHVVVLRSLGKSHGVGGLRLGLLGSADAALAGGRSRAAADLERQLARRGVPADRPAPPGRLPTGVPPRRRGARATGEALASLRGLRVAPSQANFLFAARRRRRGPRAGARALLERHEILVKDCTGKSGFPGSAHLRVAVRAPDENDRIARAFADVLGVAR
jgi:histidinol-phosphate/aromatic aminotransferase/cobyric acid decarboxylase-like protein